MPLMPKKTKYRKQQKGRIRGKATRGTKVTEGEYGLQAVEAGQITSNQIEAARVAMNRYMKRSGKVWIKIFPDKPRTKKPADTRMGKGKGAVEYWVAIVKPGRVMFEIAGVPEDVAREALRLASMKLSVKTKFVVGENAGKGMTFKIKAKDIVDEPATETAAEESNENVEEVKEESAEVAEVKEETIE